MSVLPLSVQVSEPHDARGTPLVLLPSLGTAAEVWDGIVAELVRARPMLRVLRPEFPGHGSSAPAGHDLTVPDLAATVLHAVRSLAVERFHVGGMSLGGAVALELALQHPGRVASLAMFGSGARLGEPVTWRQRASQVRASGTVSVVEVSALRWFSAGYLEREPDGLGARLLELLATVDDESYAACCSALAGFDRTADVHRVRVPALLVSGEHDVVTPPSAMRSLAEQIPGARYAELAGAAHLAAVERPAEAAALLGELLDAADASDHPASAPEWPHG